LILLTGAANISNAAEKLSRKEKTVIKKPVRFAVSPELVDLNFCKYL
jgi:hypothetical protein